MSERAVRYSITAVAFAAIVGRLVWPTLAIDGIAVMLLLVAVVPWLAPIFRSIEFPGGWKVEFQDLQKAADRADSAGLLAPAAEAGAQNEFSLKWLAEQDPNLALAGLRIEIERRLVSLAQEKGIDAHRTGVGTILRELTRRQVLSPDERSVLLDMLGLLNNAVHGAKVDCRAANWALDIGPRLLRALDKRIVDAKLFRS